MNILAHDAVHKDNIFCNLYICGCKSYLGIYIADDYNVK